MQKSIYLLPKTIETITTLDDSHVQPYLDSINSYNNPKARETLKKVSTQNQLFAGSSPFIQLQLAYMNEENPGLFPDKSRPATRQDLELALAQDHHFLDGTYTEFGLALKTTEDTYEPNNYLAKTLAKQLEQRNISLGSGKLIPFSALAKPREDSKSEYGLVFDLNDSATKDNILDLDSFNWDYSRDQGLARACRDYRDWDCNYGVLAYSDGGGRVVGVAEVESKNLPTGFSEEELKIAFETAGIPGNYELVRQHLQDI